jgi:D-aminoacyl-tRNA deacylase
VRIVVQRVSSARVVVDDVVVGQIGCGLMILLGVETGDTEAEIEWGARKAAELRIFEDAQGKMNLSVLDVGGQALVVSQFTLCADIEKGRRPSFVNAAPPEEAEKLYDFFVDELRRMNIATETGTFAAKMSVSLVNEGPVTILLEKQHEKS